MRKELITPVKTDTAPPDADEEGTATRTIEYALGNTARIVIRALEIEAHG